MDYFHVDEDYLSTMGIGFIAGKNFNPQNPESNKTKILINQLSVDKFGLGSPSEVVWQVLSRGNNLWLQNLAYRVNMDVKTVVLSLFFISVLTVLTVGSQALRAAFLNPSTNLRNE